MQNKNKIKGRPAMPMLLWLLRKSRFSFVSFAGTRSAQQASVADRWLRPAK
jgi:hypothetical protein